MRTELREVTVKQEVYIADDGTEFMDEEECVDYEFNLLEKTLDIYNSNYEKVTDVESCHIANLHTSADVKNFIKACEVYGIIDDGIDGPGLYMYGYSDVWVNLDDIVAHFRGGVTNDQT